MLSTQTSSWQPPPPPQLNTSAFATCLLRRGGNSTPDAPPDLPALKRRYNFSLADGLLIYLALYPGQRLPALNRSRFRFQKSWGQISEWVEATHMLGVNNLKDRPASTKREPLTFSSRYSLARSLEI